ncbi:crossover junction endodeoxyribonuclease RuvC [Herbiconiux sp. CPCC 203407]|uniref:Crossover junction endodeoxyribonuclease RuvC n=1 Tax=Herbiconiux oxytropis TaxID=2970915 RepID=A0AA42BT54_9MICO|nr:crossover junction endodeoxyribonuclease RuvC [Herbiconiux oxytropis]MCS5720447.1 crossover junction endodeoxyribonuclease RuvC [Herbiconiux oxytropis]MCS5726020.1 crossover junction endodeoxyribonuclease RuvC [Herbiconiux oxytropis]
MRVLGIDPGLTRCGVGIVDVTATRTATLVHVSVIQTPPDMPLAERLLIVSAGIEALIDEHSPHSVAVERVFAQHNVRTVMGTAQVSGIALLAAARRSLPVGLHTPSEVKAAITGYGQADKKQVGTMVAKVLRLESVPKPADAADALALAICHAWRVPLGSGSAAQGAQGVPGSGAATGLTAAQQAWRAAEQGTARRSAANRLAR